MITKLHPKDHRQWLEMRANGIGASEISAVLGVNHFSTPAQLFHRKRAERAGEINEAQTQAMQRGHVLEEAVANWWQLTTGRTYIKASAEEYIVRNSLRPYLQASPDRTFWPNGAVHNEASKCILECKSTNMGINPHPETGELPIDDIPLSWQFQLQWLMGACGYGKASIAVIGARFQFGWRDFDFDPRLFTDMLTVADDFWTRVVETGIEPDPISEEDMLAHWPTSTCTTQEVPAEVVDICELIKSKKDAKKKLDEEIEKAELSVKAYFKDAEAIAHQGQVLATWKSPKPSLKLDAKAMEAAHPEIAAQYKVETQGARRFLIK